MPTTTQSPASTIPFIPYGRTSRLGSRDAEDNVSRGEQFANVRAIGNRHGLALMDREFYDGDASGSTFERPEWEAAIAMIRSGEAAGIVAFDLKRIGRAKTGEMLAMIEDVESAGGKLYDGSGRVSVDDADAELMATVKAMIGRREWRERRAYLLASVENAVVKRGVHLQVPFGYERSAGRGSKLAIFEPEARVVRKAYARRAAGWSWHAIADEANADAEAGNGAFPRPRVRKRGEAPKTARWTHKTIRGLVAGDDGNGRKVYLGTAFNGTHAVPNAHPAIVDADTFRLATRAKGTKPRGPERGYLGTGMFRCVTCGYTMVHNGPLYRCNPRQHAEGKCPNPVGVPTDQADAFLLADFKARFCNMEAVGIVDDAAVIAAQAAVHQAERNFAAKFTLAAQYTGAAAKIAKAEADEAARTLEGAEADLVSAQSVARAADLPAGLDEDTVDAMLARGEVDEVRTLMSRVYGVVTVRKAERWREPVTDRMRIFLTDETPAGNDARIAFVRALAH